MSRAVRECRALIRLAALAVLVIGAVVAVSAAADPMTSAASPESFVPLTPARVLDTRGGARVGNAAGTGAPYVLKVLGQGGVPSSGVGAVALNVTVTLTESPTIGGGYVTVYPCGTRPDASNLNFVGGQTIPNSVIAPVSAAGEVCFYVYGTAHLIADVSGYFPTGSGSPPPAILGANDIVKAASNGDGTATITVAPGTTAPTVGQYLALASSQLVPGGAYTEVIGANGSSVTVGPAGLGDVFPNANINQSLKIASAELEPTAPATLSLSDGATASFAALLTPGMWDCGAEDPTDLFGSIEPLKVSIENFEFEHLFNPPASGTLGYLSVAVQGEFKFEFGVTPSASYKCELSPTFRRSHRIINLSFPLPGGVQGFVNLEPAFEISASAEGRIGYAITRPFRSFVQISDGRVTSGNGSRNTNETFTAEAALTGSAFAGGELAVAIGGGTALFGYSAGIAGRFGPQVDVKVDSSNPTCVTVEAFLKLTVSARFDAWVASWGPRFNQKIGDITGPKNPLANSPYCIPGTNPTTTTTTTGTTAPTTTISPTTTTAPGGGTGSATSVSAGGVHSCALLAGGTVKCWGYNAYGLGDGTTTGSSAPVTVTGITNATAVSARGEHSCALLADGTIKCWGNNAEGQLGDGTTTGSSTPVTVTGISTATAVSANFYHSCALLASGTVKCWGYGPFGALGSGSTVNSSTPVTVTGITNAMAVVAGYESSCALLASGTVKCWGYNGNGQLGDGTNTSTSTPVTVSGITTATAVTAGGYNSCALLASGTVKCWGYNAYGLGDGTTTGSSMPVTVAGIATATAIDGGGSDQCALLASGTVKCWGYNVVGALGNGTTINSSTPVTVTGITTATAVAAGGLHTCAVLADGTVKCWGFNSVRQLGNGTTIDSPTPVSVIGL